VIEAAERAVRLNVYAPSHGLPALRGAIAAKLARENGVDTDPDDVLVTNGAMHALFIVFGALLRPGDEVIIPTPSWFFHPQIEFFGGIPVKAPRRPPDEGFRPDLEQIRNHVSPRTRIILVCSPSNPTGTLYSRRELEGIAGIAEDEDLVLVADESYEKVVYDGRRHVSAASLDSARERTITVQSFTKSYAMPGWRVGYLSAPGRSLEPFLRILQWSTICCNYVAQQAALAALTGPQHWVAAMFRRYEQCRDLFHDGLAKIAGITAVRPEGGPFAFPSFARFGMDTDALAAKLLNEQGVVSVPGSAFFARDHIRIPFGGEDAEIATAVARINTCVTHLTP
jgi:aspartate/methionine/tyrosine aminotransferase